MQNTIRPEPKNEQSTSWALNASGLFILYNSLPVILVKTYTNPGDTVLDNCMGSGSTGVACLHTGRHFIGMERDPHFYQTARQRLNQEFTNANLVADRAK